MKIIEYGISETGSSGINGDVFYIAPDKNVFLLADGASGAGKEGKVLMGKICVQIVNEFPFDNTQQGARVYVAELFNRINNKLIKVSQEHNKLIFGTLNILVIDNNIATLTSLGDSPIFYYDGTETRQIARNKKKYEGMIDAGYITREQYDGYIKQMHGMMWSCFDHFVPTIVPNNEICQVELKEENILVMCCDGMSDWIKGEEIIEKLKNNNIEHAAKSLIDEAKHRALKGSGYYDDITVLAIKCV